mgnify:CR=1 FL=1
MDGRRPSISETRFRQIYHVLSLMRCWDPAEAAAPWKTRILYTLPIRALEVDPPWSSDGVHAIVETDEHAEKVTPFVFLETPQTITGAKVGVRIFDSRRNYIQPGSHHQAVELQQVKRFTFRSSFTWQYECIVSYKDPCTSPDGNTMAFTETPFYHVTLKCLGLNDRTKTADYLTHSLLAKLRDLSPSPSHGPGSGPGTVKLGNGVVQR